MVKKLFMELWSKTLHQAYEGIRTDLGQSVWVQSIMVSRTWRQEHESTCSHLSRPGNTDRRGSGVRVENSSSTPTPGPRSTFSSEATSPKGPTTFKKNSTIRWRWSDTFINAPDHWFSGLALLLWDLASFRTPSGWWMPASLSHERQCLWQRERERRKGRLCGKKCWCWAVGSLPGQKTAVEQGLATVWDRKQFSHAPLREPQSTITAHVSGKAWVFYPTKQD